tara:strand:+ start:465 stop:1379 length:915 start_codon:yes stop_codon:yes gene_type:complete
MPPREPTAEEVAEVSQQKKRKKSQSKKSQKEVKASEDLQPDPEEPEEQPPPKKKKQVKKKPVEEEEEEEPEAGGEEADEGGGEEEGKEKKERDPAKVLKTRREHKRCSGYRLKAKEAGYLKVGGGIDMHKSSLSVTDAKRLLRFYPEVLDKSSYSEEETKERMMLAVEALPTSTARVAQAGLESLYRYLMTESLWRAQENGKTRVNAQHVHAAFRRYAPYMRYTAVDPPKGLIKHALSEGVTGMAATEDDMTDDKIKSEKAENASLVKQQKAMEKAEEARKKAYHDRKAYLADLRAKKEAAEAV